MAAPLEPVRRTHLIPGASPAELFAIVTDFAAYPRLFHEITSARVLETHGARVRVEFRATVVIPVRYVLDVMCEAQALTVDWTFVEGEVISNSVGGWRFTSGPGGSTLVEYRAALDVKAPLPGFVLRKVTDLLLTASLPAMFSALGREVAARRS